MRPPGTPRAHRPPVTQPAPAALVPAAAAASPTLQAIEAGPPYRVERASSLREAVARNMIASAAVPMFRVTARLPLDFLVSTAKQRHLSVALVLARACALTIASHPLFNAEEARTVSTEARAKVTLENLFATLDATQAKVLKVVVKADTQGSVEAIVEALKKIEPHKFRWKSFTARWAPSRNPTCCWPPPPPPSFWDFTRASTSAWPTWPSAKECRSSFTRLFTN